MAAFDSNALSTNAFSIGAFSFAAVIAVPGGGTSGYLKTIRPRRISERSRNISGLAFAPAEGYPWPAAGSAAELEQKRLRAEADDEEALIYILSQL